MSDIGFYHLTRSPLETALPKLLEKAFATGKKIVVRAGSEERVQALNSALWTYDQDSFLPHGTVREGSPEHQPIWLTNEQENPNKAAFLVLTDGADADDLDQFERCFDMFDGKDEQAVAAARERWRLRRDAGHDLTYWQQNASGGWEQKAEG